MIYGTPLEGGASRPLFDKNAAYAAAENVAFLTGDDARLAELYAGDRQLTANIPG